MSMDDIHFRIQAAARFLLQSPPGEINDVLNDVRNIIDDDVSLERGAQHVLREYNLAQFTVADVPGHEHQSIISDAAKLVKDNPEDDRFYDPRSQTSFRFNHLSLESFEGEHEDPDSESEPFRAALETATLAYLSAHFHDGVASVFATSNSATRFVIQVVANKYNAPNFWCGRWRSEYILDLAERKLEGKVLVNVHYYEQGNVQLETSHDISIPLPPAITADTPGPSGSKVLALIEDEEGRYQTALTDAYTDMSEKTFKSLRRALPLTRQKLDWDRVLGYKLGAELTASKGVFGES